MTSTISIRHSQSDKKMHLPAAIATLALALGDAASPVSAAPRSDRCEDRDVRVALFEMWNTECNVGSGHTWGMSVATRAALGFCQPLPDDTHALRVTEIADGCRGTSNWSDLPGLERPVLGPALTNTAAVTAFRSPICDDYPHEGAYIAKTGCLWTGGTLYRSYRVTCED